MSQGQFLSNCAADTLSQAALSLKNGALVVLPTETVYGLGADASNEKAVSRIYEVKGTTPGSETTNRQSGLITWWSSPGSSMFHISL
jgi:tRNA A37 threonylcarbamoyladenosine synthetase subunit TsaC/SUA5/YrdC